MRRYLHHMDVVSSTGGSSYLVPAATSTPAPLPAFPGTSSETSTSTLPGSSAPQSPSLPGSNGGSHGDVQKYLDSTLKNAGYKAETVFGSGNRMFVRVVDADSGKIVLQVPSPAVMAIVAAAEQQDASERGSASAKAATGAIIDEVA